MNLPQSLPSVLLGQGIDVIQEEVTRFRRRGSVDDDWGRSESLDPDDVGDIADEGAGHRG